MGWVEILNGNGFNEFEDVWSFRILKSGEGVLAQAKADSFVFLVEDGVVVVEEIQAEDPHVHAC